MNCPACLSTDHQIQKYLSDYFKCNKCGLIFKRTHDDPGNIIKHYDEVDPKESVSASKETFFKFALRQVDAKKKNHKYVLDIGCGTGDFLLRAQKAGWKSYGVEISTALAEEANKRLKSQNVFAGPLKDAFFPANKFGFISLWDSLVHSENPYKELKEVQRVLKDNGTVGIRVRNILFQKTIRALYFKFHRLAGSLGLKNPSVFHNYCFSKKSIIVLLERAGFLKVRVLNSPLSKGDPYKHAKLSIFITLSKVGIDMLSKLVFIISGGKLVIGPSLLVWAQKAK